MRRTDGAKGDRPYGNQEGALTTSCDKAGVGYHEMRKNINYDNIFFERLAHENLAARTIVRPKSFTT